MEERISEKEFQQRVGDILDQIGPETLFYYEAKDSACSALYSFISQYAEEKKLINTAVALPLVRGIISCACRERYGRFEEESRYLVNFEHCLYVCRILIDLHLPLSAREEDIVLASSICHILPESVPYKSLEEEMTRNFHLDPEIYKIVSLISEEDDLPDAEQQEFYDRIQENRLALLIKLADRGNLVEHLHSISNWNVHKYIHENRVYYLPMCIYAKEHYHELLAPVSILMEKMKNLIEISEMLLIRYEARELELVQEIMSLKEENAVIKGIIQKIKKENRDTGSEDGL